MVESTEEERNREDITGWLLGQIQETTYLERLKFIGDVIAEDIRLEADFTKDPANLKALRTAYAEQIKQLEHKTVN